MKNRITPLAIVVLLVVMAGCSSSDPTTSDEYAALEQELAQIEIQLAGVTAELEVQAEETAAVVAAAQESPAAAAPDEIATLIDDWYTALDLGDDSVLELYVPEGYHLYGDTRLEYDEIPGHLSGGDIEHVWITEPLLITDEGDGRYVAVRGMRNTNPGVWSNASAVIFEIVTTGDDELRLAQTAWFYDSEWSG